jgi:hypothetical protein
MFFEVPDVPMHEAIPAVIDAGDVDPPCGGEDRGAGEVGLFASIRRDAARCDPARSIYASTEADLG